MTDLVGFEKTAKWINAGADPTDPEALTASDLQDYHALGVISVVQQSSINEIDISVTPLGNYELERRAAADKRGDNDVRSMDIGFS